MKKTAGLDGFRRLVLANFQESDNYNLIQIFPEARRGGNALHLILRPVVLHQAGKDSMKKIKGHSHS